MKAMATKAPKEIEKPGPAGLVEIVIRLADRFGSIIFALGFSYILLTQTLPSQRKEFVDALKEQQASFQRAVEKFDQALKDQSAAHTKQIDAERAAFERMIREVSNGQTSYSP